MKSEREQEMRLKRASSANERRLLLSWAKAGKDSKGRSKATRSEGDDLGDSAARAKKRHAGEDVGEVKGVEEVDV